MAVLSLCYAYSSALSPEIRMSTGTRRTKTFFFSACSYAYAVRVLAPVMLIGVHADVIISIFTH